MQFYMIWQHYQFNLFVCCNFGAFITYINTDENNCILNLARKKYGTQVKFVLDFGYDRKALFKPQRFKISIE